MYDELWALATTAGHILVELWWFIVVAILIASLIATLKLNKKVGRLFDRAGAWAILGALLLGLVSPL